MIKFIPIVPITIINIVLGGVFLLTDSSTGDTLSFLIYIIAIYVTFLLEKGKDNKRIAYDAFFIALWAISASALELTAEALAAGKAPYIHPWIALFLPLLPWKIVRHYERKHA